LGDTLVRDGTDGKVWMGEGDDATAAGDRRDDVTDQALEGG
jgi:hypothetical protein